MFCKKCGTEIPDDAQFCKKCGASTSDSNNQPQQSSESSGTASSGTNLFDLIKWCISHPTGALFFVVIVSGVVYYILVQMGLAEPPERTIRSEIKTDLVRYYNENFCKDDYCNLISISREVLVAEKNTLPLQQRYFSRYRQDQYDNDFQFWVAEGTFQDLKNNTLCIVLKEEHTITETSWKAKIQECDYVVKKK